jgi:hypothetical protein
MTKRRMRQYIALASVALVLVAAGVTTGNRWTLDFAQYKGDLRPVAEDEFRFIIVGDRTGGAQWGLMPQTFREINLLDPDFVISVGDLIDGYGNDEETVNGIWDEFEKTEMSVLKVPFVFMPGNHDIFNATSKRVYEKRYGPRFRSFNYRGLHFITLNTQERVGENRGGGGGRGGDAFGEEQLEWLKDDIAANRNARRILIFMHTPSWNSLEPVYPMLEGLPVSIFAGHYHKYSYQEIRGIPHIICGATAAYIPDEGVEAYGRFRSYLMATVRDSDFKLALIRLGGVLNPKLIMEKDQTSIRKLTDASAILRDGENAVAPSRVAFRNPMPMPVRLQIVKSTRGSSKHLFDGDEPLIEPEQVWEKEVDWSSFAGHGSSPAEYRVLYRFDNSGGEYQTVDFPIEARVCRTARARAVATPPTIDGDLADWSGSSWNAISDGSQATFGAEAWEGTEDLSAQFAIAEDAKNIYFAIRVADDTVAYGSRGVDADSVALYLSDPDQGISFYGEPDFLPLLLSPFSESSEGDAGATAGKARVERLRPPGGWGGGPGAERFSDAQAAFTRDPKAYIVELAIPRSVAGWDDPQTTARRIDVAINDRDVNTRRESQLTWSGNDRNVFSSRYFGVLRPATQ